MKKELSFITAITVSLGLFAQLTAPTTPSNKNVLLEDLTGIYCGYCPDGALRADQLKAAAAPGRVIIIGNHCSSYATPGSGANRLDFRTNDGNIINSASVPTGYPAGNINRKVTTYSMTPGKTAMGRGSWATVGGTTMNEASPLNLAAKATHAPGNSTINIEVAGYYTAAGSGSDYITVAILQDKIDSYQSGASGYPARVQPGGLYRQMDVLRDYLTGPMGDAITTTTMGTAFNKTYTFNATAPIVHTFTGPSLTSDVVPVIDDMKVVAFVTTDAGWSEVITAVEVHVTVQSVGIDESASLNNVNIYPNPFQTETTVEFNLDAATPLTITMYDVTGKVVNSLGTTTYSAGNHRLPLSGSSLEAGLYYVSIVSPEGTMTRKLMLNK